MPELPDGTPFHYLRIEVTAAAALVAPDDTFVGDNMVDATLVFGWRTADPGTRSDAEINGGLTQQMSVVMALLSTALITQGWLAMGQTDTPMTEHSHEVGHGLTTPVTVHVVPAGEGAHD